MGNSTSKFLNDIGSFLGTALAAPFKSLLGRSCQDVCVGMWDVVCFIEHICIADLVKFLLVCCLCYICLVFLYLLYKLGICQCVAKTSCKMSWAACERIWLGLDYLCCFCWHKIRYTKRVYRGRRQRQHRRHLHRRHLSGGDVEMGYASPSELSVVSVVESRHGHGQRQHGHHLHRRQMSGGDVEMGYASTTSASSIDNNNNNNSVVYSDDNDAEPSIIGRKRKSLSKRRRRRRKMKEGRSIRMDKRQVSIHHLKKRSMKERSLRRKNHLKHSQLSTLRPYSQRTMKFKRQRTR